ncbi:MAG: hypothetical protein QM751_08655 [Paludibacteraceae bacterium]
MKISYYLNNGRNKNLYCRISDGSERVTFSLDYTVDAKKWNAKNEEVNDEDVHYFTLINLKKYLAKKYHELKNEGKEDVLNRLKNEAVSLTGISGIEGIAEKIFNFFNKDNNLAEYKEFVLAFEKFSGLKKDNYKVEIIGTVIHFHTKETIYEMDTYEGLTSRLKSLKEERSYDEIYTETNGNIWSDIYIDPGIEKHVFLPKMLNEWEIYWIDEYKDIRESVGRTSHLDEMKQHSWRQFQVYMACYDGAGDAIRLACEIDEDVLYPIAVIAMLDVFDADTCYGEYCESEFFGNSEWETIPFDDENEEIADSPTFFIRPYEI